ncbi:hypothetical protein ACFX2C_018096 [Malus domestica]
MPNGPYILWYWASSGLAGVYFPQTWPIIERFQPRLHCSLHSPAAAQKTKKTERETESKKLTGSRSSTVW